MRSLPRLTNGNYVQRYTRLIAHRQMTEFPTSSCLQKPFPNGPQLPLIPNHVGHILNWCQHWDIDADALYGVAAHIINPRLYHLHTYGLHIRFTAMSAVVYYDTIMAIEGFVAEHGWENLRDLLKTRQEAYRNKPEVDQKLKPHLPAPPNAGTWRG